MTDATDALKALEETRAIRADVVQRAACPPHWHAAFGAMMASLVAGQAAPSTWAMLILALCMVGVVLMVRAQRRRMGFFVNGYRKGRTRRVALLLLVFVEGVLGLSLWAKYGLHLPWAPLAGGAVVFPVAIFASYAWQGAYRADLLGGKA